MSVTGYRAGEARDNDSAIEREGSDAFREDPRYD